MLKVKKQKQLQETNRQLIEIRKIELSYYYNFFTTFGDVGALLTGFLFGTITQILGEYLLIVNPGRWLKDLYWFSACISMLVGLSLMLHTTTSVVYGQGKSLYGRIGAVTEVIEGFKAEEGTVLFSFLLMIFTYGISLIGAFNLVYYEIEAIISSVFTLICMYYWYRDSVDLYNWFKWTDADEAEANDFKSDRVMHTDATGRVYSDDLAKNDPISMVNRRMEEDDIREKMQWTLRDDEAEDRSKKSHR